MLTVFVLTVVLTACAVLGDDEKSCEEKYCNLDLAQTLCMENFNLTQADGKLVTMMMMIMTSTMVVVVMVIIIMVVMMVKMIMVVMVMMPMLIVLMMVAMVVVMMMLLVVVLQMAMLVIAMMMIGIFMMVMVMTIKILLKGFRPSFVAHEDCLLIETLKFVSYNYTLFFLPQLFSPPP